MTGPDIGQQAALPAAVLIQNDSDFCKNLNGFYTFSGR
jgi:hypothetical protein